MDLPMKLVSLRKEKGLTQLELAEYLHVSRQAISRWEVGAAVPSTDNLKVLSALYGVSADYLLHDGAEKSGETAENQAHAPKEQGWIVISKKSVGIFVCALLIVVAFLIGVAIGATAIPRKEEAEVTSIEDMTKVVEDGFPVETFYLNPIG